MSLVADYLGAFEEHSPEGIRAALRAGASATAPIDGKRLVDCLIEGYLGYLYRRQFGAELHVCNVPNRYPRATAMRRSRGNGPYAAGIDGPQFFAAARQRSLASL